DEVEAAGGQGGGGQGRPAGGGRDDAARLGQRRPLAVEALGVGVGAEHVGDDGRATAAGPDLGADGGEDLGGVGMGAVAEDDVEEDDGDVGPGPFDAQVLEPRLGVDHRVGPALGELLLTEVEANVGVVGGGQAPALPERRVGV